MSPTTPIASRDLPWLTALVLVGVFQIIRGTWDDVLIFAIALACALWQAVHRDPPDRRISGVPPLNGLVTAAIVVGVLLVLLPRHSIAAGVVIVIIGAAGLTVALLGGWPAEPTSSTLASREPRPALRTAMVAWGCIVLVAGLWEATAYLTWKWGLLADGVMPSISDVVDPLLDTVVGKIVFVGVWITTGVAVLRRGPRSSRVRQEG
ncbi:hypothetical protein SAMN04489806_3081 [Paramicrobacterium humi]|uniref:Uncharacterized protein n=1 Tax=Paramicrobacterium humi TaxID=640635 RepID=A0A1H4T244_9MICO|nr:hypothetical protein [Microbacterium humi]SEC50545.1 hypothetical protein SAMN04489806_3081 [Microbacterium humi]